MNHFLIEIIISTWKRRRINIVQWADCFMSTEVLKILTLCVYFYFYEFFTYLN